MIGSKTLSTAAVPQKEVLGSKRQKRSQVRPNVPLAKGPSNKLIAEKLRELASLLEQQKANPFRIKAYRQAANTLENLKREASMVFLEKGRQGLIQIPTIGDTIASTIATLVITGKFPLLERLKGESEPEKLLSSIPGIGQKTAQVLHEELGIESLEQLEHALTDKRLHDLAGIGEKRLEGIKNTLRTRLGRKPRFSSLANLPLPPVSELLEVDREYRQKDQAHSLFRIAPKRFNPSGEAWLSVLHTSRGSRDYTALFSNTARAHALNKTHDWVVIYLQMNGFEKPYTVITAQYGPLTGKRMVRGREMECQAFYSSD